MGKVLITGGSGFVGKYFAAHFLAENYFVTGLAGPCPNGRCGD